jgi:hypothetical protein
MAKDKKLTPKQKYALELLTCGRGLKYKDIANEVGIDHKTLWSWRNAPEFAHFQDELKRINDERWLATVDAAREAAFRLVEQDNPKMVEFILKNEGYNPTQKIEADVKTDIQINIED